MALWLTLATVTKTAGAAPAIQPSAEAYLGWLDSAIERQVEQIDAVTQSADAAAEAFITHERWAIGIIGSAGFAGEANGRAGGIIRINNPRHVVNRRWRGVVLVGLLNQTLKTSLQTAKTKSEQGCHIVLFGTAKQREAAERAGVDFDAFLETGAKEADGLVRTTIGRGGEPRRVLPTQHVANMVTMWTWTGEFVAALTRRGKMTPMYMAYAVPGGRVWRETIGMKKFHDPGLRVDPVDSGTLGKAFLAALRADLAAVAKTQLEAVRRAAALAVATRDNGGDLFGFFHGHAFTDCLGGPHDPGYFSPANHRWMKQPEETKLGSGDLAFCVGFDRLFEGEWFNHFASRMRKRDVRLVWSIGVNNPQHDYTAPDGEPIIDQCWSFGDASVAVPGYPVKILPTSGIIAQSVVWLVQAEMLKLDGA